MHFMNGVQRRYPSKWIHSHQIHCCRLTLRQMLLLRGAEKIKLTTTHFQYYYFPIQLPAGLFLVAERWPTTYSGNEIHRISLKI